MNLAEAAEKLLSKLSEAIKELAEAVANALDSLTGIIDVEAGYKAPLTLDRPLMALKYPETFKYLKNKRLGTYA